MIISPPCKRWLNSDLWFEWISIFQELSPPLSLFPSISPFNKRVNDVCALISNQLFLFSFYLSLDKFSVAPVESNASPSIVLYLITNWPSDGKQANNEGTFTSESVTSALTLLHHKFVSTSFHKIKYVHTLTSYLCTTEDLQRDSIQLHNGQCLAASKKPRASFLDSSALWYRIS